MIQQVFQRMKYGAMSGVFLLTVIASSVVLTSSASAFAGGNGSQAAPYQIATCAQIKDIDNSAANLDAYYQVTADLDCGADGSSIMVGAYDLGDSEYAYFSGVFDGQGHSITINVESDNDDSFYGLFRQTESRGDDPTVIRDVRVTGSVSATSANYVGGLVGQARETSFIDTYSDTTVGGYEYVGGLVGAFDAYNDPVEISNSGSIGSTTGEDRVGGLVGHLSTFDGEGGATTTLNNLTSSSAVTGVSQVGGLVGRLTMPLDSSLENSYTTGNVTANGEQVERIGGLVGSFVNGSVRRTYATGTIHATNTAQAMYVGGLVGEMTGYSQVAQSFATGNVTANGDLVGGLVGGTASNTEETIINSYARGDVSGDSAVGGFVGGHGSYFIVNSYSTGDVQGSSEDVGGFIGGQGEAGTAASFWDTETSGMDTSTGQAVGKTTAEMTDVNTFTTELFDDSWNFDTIWQISASYNDGYPCLSWNVGCSGDEEPTLAITTFSPTNNATLVSVDRDTLSMTFNHPVEIYDGTAYLNTYDDDQEVEEFWGDPQVTVSEDGLTVYLHLSNPLLPNTRYYVEFDSNFVYRIDSEEVFGNIMEDKSYWNFTTGASAAADDDQDGVSSEIENAAPNNGDANNDGILDSEQPHVASFVNVVTGTYSVVALDGDCSLTNASAISESGSRKDAGYNYKTGLINFSADCEASSVAVKVYQYGVRSESLVLRKFVPSTSAYFSVPGASLATESIDGQAVTIASYTIIDNGTLDLNPAVGKITDPVGLADLVVAAPNTGFRR